MLRKAVTDSTVVKLTREAPAHGFTVVMVGKGSAFVSLHLASVQFNHHTSHAIQTTALRDGSSDSLALVDGHGGLGSFFLFVFVLFFVFSLFLSFFIFS